MVIARQGSLTFQKSAHRIAARSTLMPGGVGSDFRLGIAPTPLVFDRAEGPYLWDVDGNRLIDYYLGMGPMILGHRPPAVVEAVTRQLELGILYAGQSEVEYEAAALVASMVPCAEMVRFGSSGTEAVQAALRLARAATGRQRIVGFEGHYHGWLDNVLWSRSDDPDGTLLPGSLGQEDGAGRNLDLLRWNDAQLVVERVQRGDIAAVIMEASMCNSSAVRPAPGYLKAVRAACTATGTVLIFDEVITGFRIGAGGAQERLGVTPDLAVFGKAIASGFPVAALAGRRDLMELIGGPGHVIHAGTYNGQAIAMAATVATLTCLRDGRVYEELEQRGSRLMTELRAMFARHDVEAVVQGWPQIFYVAFGVTSEIADHRAMLKTDRAGYREFTATLLMHGVRALERGAWFLSSEHADGVLDETLGQIDNVLATRDGGF